MKRVATTLVGSAIALTLNACCCLPGWWDTESMALLLADNGDTAGQIQFVSMEQSAEAYLAN